MSFGNILGQQIDYHEGNEKVSLNIIFKETLSKRSFLVTVTSRQSPDIYSNLQVPLFPIQRDVFYSQVITIHISP